MMRRAFCLRAVSLVFIVAATNGAAWSLLTPPFQVPDETAHFAYAQSIAENGSGPGIPGRPEFSSEQMQAMTAMGTFTIIGRPLVHPPIDDVAADAALREAAEMARRGDGGGPSSASTQPPLYYVLAALPYKAFSWATVPTRLHAMRALSVLMFALAAALSALIAAEFVPRHSWAPLVGGMAVALSPYTAFIASGVTPDALLLALSAATVLVVARTFRQGLTVRRALVLGLILGAGTLTKLTFLAFLPPALAVVAFLVFRDRRNLAEGRESAFGALCIAIAAAITLPVVAFVVTELVFQSGQPGTLEVVAGPDGTTNLRESMVYGWQLFLPRLPFMSPQFAYFPPTSTWIDGFAGRYGWLDYAAPSWVASWFQFFIATAGLLTVATVIRAREAVASRGAEALAYIGFSIALAAAIAKTGYDYRRATGFVFEQPRYLFALVGLYSGFITVACLGLGRRFAPKLAILAIGLFCLHDMTGLTQTMLRYYG